MECPICSWTPENVEYRLICEMQHWRVVLAPNQSLPGRCVVPLKRHAGDLAELRPAELLEWLRVVKRLENALRAAFGAAMFNWSCYMNHAYRQPAPDPHIHWWAVPRYDRPVVIDSLQFEDPHFGDPYDHDRWLTLPPPVQADITARIIRNLS